MPVKPMRAPRESSSVEVLGEKRAGMGTSPGALSWRMIHHIVELEVILKHSQLASPFH